jgi:DNA-binding MarR family transcriptional regulator
MDDARLVALLESITRAVGSEQRLAAVGGGLLPIQWSILNYLRLANRYSNTAQALAEYLSLTKGTVSQSLKLLEANGWIRRETDAADRRIVRLALTRAGRQRLDASSADAWRDSVASLPAAERKAAEQALASLLRTWQLERGRRSFGVCASCRHFQVRAADDAHRCGLTGEPLSEADSLLICREHEMA